MNNSQGPWNFQDTSVVILGAGFSCAATDGRMPLMSNFFKGIDRVRYSLLVRFVEAVEGDIDSANVETVLLALDQIGMSPSSVLEGWAEEWGDEYEQIREQLTWCTLDRLKCSLEISDGNWAANMLDGCGPNTTVITVNYDNIAESILSNRPGIIHHGAQMNCPHCKMRYLLYRACSCDGRYSIDDDVWRGALLKLHGSIAWKRCLNKRCCNYECLVADEQCRPFEPCTCHDCCNECAPVMVMPTMSKNLKEIPEIGVMWQAARKALAEAESILIFGFSLPSSDELLTQMIKSSIKSKNRLARVGIIDLNPEEIIERFRRCVPKDCHVRTTSFPVTDSGPPLNVTGRRRI